MTTLSLRARRHQQALKLLDQLEKRRDVELDRLTWITTKLKATRRTLARYEKASALAPVAKPAQKAAVMPPPAPDPTTRLGVLGPAPTAADDDIPDFLRRKRDADNRDEVAREAILAEQAERKRNKARVRIETMKAKRAGDMKRMPLEGKAALAAIRQ